MAAKDSLEEIAKPYLTARIVIVSPIVTLASLLFVYGMYTIVFGLCLHVLRRRGRSGPKVYLLCTISLFTLATPFVASEIFGRTRQAIIDFQAAKTRNFEPLVRYLRQDDGKTAWLTTNYIVTTLMNMIADVMLIHRCYVLWGLNRFILCMLSAAALILNGISLVAAILSAIGISSRTSRRLYKIAAPINYKNSIAIAVFNGLLSLLTAGRIWWISREARRHMGMPIHSTYKSIVAAILESGLLYPITLLISMLVPLVMDPTLKGTIPFDLEPTAALMSGLAPTLIIVRVAYGKSVESVQQMMSIHFAERTSHQATGPTAGISRGTAEIRARSENDHGDGVLEEVKLVVKGDESRMI